MRFRALRGVCIGVDQHLKAGDTVDLEPAQATYLVNIGAVELVKEPEPALVREDPKPEVKAAPEKPARKEK